MVFDFGRIRIQRAPTLHVCDEVGRPNKVDVTEGLGNVAGDVHAVDGNRDREVEVGVLAAHSTRDASIWPSSSRILLAGECT